MLDKARIQEIEKILSDNGKSVAELCREANIAETTWGRWKNGSFFPSYQKAMAVNDALDSLVGRSASESAA